MDWGIPWGPHSQRGSGDRNRKGLYGLVKHECTETDVRKVSEGIPKEN
jgi:hypothetical protein